MRDFETPGATRYGAQMGRQDHVATISTKAGHKFYMVRVRLDSGGYDPGGAYWGHGQPLYHYSCESVEDEPASGYVRGATRDAAKAEVRQKYPSAQFHR